MAKKKKAQTQKPRTDAERRTRQCERMARMLRTLRCIMGPGRWDVEALANEMECSTRTIQRILQTLAMAGVPFRYDPELRAYRVPSGFRFPGLDTSQTQGVHSTELVKIRDSSKQLLQDGEKFLDSLRHFREQLED